MGIADLEFGVGLAGSFIIHTSQHLGACVGRDRILLRQIAVLILLLLVLILVSSNGRVINCCTQSMPGPSPSQSPAHACLQATATDDLACPLVLQHGPLYIRIPENM